MENNTPYTIAQDKIRSEVDHAINPKFSPDGNHLVFMGLPKNDHPTDETWANALDIFIYSFRTNQLINLSDKAKLDSESISIDEDPTFSPNGKKVVFKRNRTDLWELSLYYYSGVSVTDSPNIQKSGPDFSPDGNWILFWVKEDENPDTRIGKIGKMASSWGLLEEVHDIPDAQAYYPRYWDDSTVIYASSNMLDDQTFDDDDIRIYYLEDGYDVSAEFNTTYDDSDPFPISEYLIGFSTMDSNTSNKYNLWYGDPTIGDAQRFNFSDNNKHDLGGSYTPHIVNFLCHDADTDDDGLIDGDIGNEDLNANGYLDPGETDPLLPDTDGDGLLDGLERGLVAPETPDTDISAGYFIQDEDPTTTTDPANPDSDGDGIFDGDEDINKNGRMDEGETSANIYTINIDIKTGSDPDCINNNGHGSDTSGD